MIVATLAQDMPGTLTGVAAALCLTAAPMFRNRRMILLVQLAAALCFAAHYLCLVIAFAAAVNMLGTVQTAAALFSARSAAMTWLGYGLIGLMVLVGLTFWQGPISALSVAATSLIAVARMQANEVRLRGLLLAGGVFWVVHDFLGEAWIALTADIGATAMGAEAPVLAAVPGDDRAAAVFAGSSRARSPGLMAAMPTSAKTTSIIKVDRTMSFSQLATANGGLTTDREQSAGHPGAIFPLGLVHRIREYSRRQRDYRHLLGRPDYLLEDIGLTRTQIVAAMRWRLF